MSIALVAPDLSFWSDTSDVGWGAHLAEEVASGLWSPAEIELSINARELLALERGLLHFQLLVSSTVSIFVDNATAMTYLRKRGHSFLDPQCHCAENSLLSVASLHCPSSPVHLGEAQRSRWHSVQAQSDPGLRVDPEDGGFSGSASKVSGDGGLVCHLVQSPLYTLFLTLPRSLCPGNGCASSGLGWSSGLRLPSVSPDSSRSPEAP